MEEIFTEILEELKSVRTYLIKIGPSRREGKILETKSQEANDILVKYNKYLDIFKLNLDQYSREEITLINEICIKFNKLYTEICSLCSVVSATMAEDKFDLKIALSMLPIMNDTEEKTKQLIESIEYYDSVLTQPECKSKLICFVLKSRLSQQAKLRMLPKYNTTEDLIKDMRRLLLPIKSYTALQTKLQTCRQNNRTVSDFGKELSEIFVNLTVSQAAGDTNKYEVLRPLNEGLAIKKFADGLRDRRLSTIIAARNFSSLTEAIQAAQDEEVQSSSAEMIGTYKSFNNRSTGQRGRRGQFRPQRSYTNGYRGRTSNNNRQNQSFQSPYQRGKYRGNNYRGNNFRGRGTFSRNRGSNFSAHSNVNTMSTETNVGATNNPNTESLSHFFRA